MARTSHGHSPPLRSSAPSRTAPHAHPRRLAAPRTGAAAHPSPDSAISRVLAFRGRPPPGDTTPHPAFTRERHRRCRRRYGRPVLRVWPGLESPQEAAGGDPRPAFWAQGKPSGTRRLGAPRARGRAETSPCVALFRTPTAPPLPPRIPRDRRTPLRAGWPPPRSECAPAWSPPPQRCR